MANSDMDADIKWNVRAEMAKRGELIAGIGRTMK